MIITVDCGTTNMRCRIFDGDKMLHVIKKKVGSRNATESGSTDCLKDALRFCINELIATAKITPADVEAVVCSGILASDVGIYALPHNIAPCGIKKSAEGARFVSFPEITEIPILLIPGIKTLPQEDETDEERKIEIWDSMSGEDCETYGIAHLIGVTGEYVITLPGSYNKILEVDAEGRITTMRTGMCGEFIAAMAEHTILKKSLPSPVIREIIPERLVQGYDYCSRHGVSPTLIKARNVQTHGNFTIDEAANFFIGALLYDDIRSAAEICISGKPVLVGGSNPLRKIFMLLLDHAGAKNLIEIADDVADLAPSVGAILVYREKLATEGCPKA